MVRYQGLVTDFLPGPEVQDGVGQYYALSHTIAGRARMKVSDGRPAAPGNTEL